MAPRTENMMSKSTALIVSHSMDVLSALKKTLDRIGVESQLVRSCHHARLVLDKPNSPDLVFSDAILPDGTCAEVILMAAQAETPAKVVVISPVIDYELYLDALEAGAADVVMPPFSDADMAWIVHSVREDRATRKSEAA